MFRGVSAPALKKNRPLSHSLLLTISHWHFNLPFSQPTEGQNPHFIVTVTVRPRTFIATILKVMVGINKLVGVGPESVGVKLFDALS